MGLPVRKGRWHAKGRKPGEMNKTETRYSQHLEERVARGEVLRWDFEPERLKVADGSWYCPDFRLLMPDGEIHFHDVKGFPEPVGRVKIKVCAEQHPMYLFFEVRKQLKKDGGGWEITPF